MKGVATREGPFNITPSDPLGNFVLPILTTLGSVGLEVQVPKGSALGDIMVWLNYNLWMPHRHFRLLCPGPTGEKSCHHSSQNQWPWAVGGAKADIALGGQGGGRNVHNQVIYLVPLWIRFLTYMDGLTQHPHSEKGPIPRAWDP